MDATRIAEGLQDAEIVVLKALAKHPANAFELEKSTLLSRENITRSALWLENKSLVTVKETPQAFVVIEKLGEEYARNGLPERHFINALRKPMYMDELIASSKLDKQEFTYSLGHWKSRSAIEIKEGKVKLLAPQYLTEKFHEEVFLQKLAEKKEMELIMLLPEEKHAFEVLAQRGIVRKAERTLREFAITELGRKVISATTSEKRIGLLTSDLIKSGAWKESSFRRYDVTAPVPQFYGGKKQTYRAFLDEVKEELVSLGFEEMSGPIVEMSFFNCEALFMPQDHPARGIHDTYFISEPKYGNLEKYRKFVEEVKKVHENGAKSGSTGWQYGFDTKESSRLMLRTQGTALSARTLASNPNVPGAYFAIARCYRPDVLDATHLVEFNQCEGIVLGDKLNFRNLLGLLAEFSKKVTGSDKLRFRPHYFPYTEPSVEADIWHPKLNKWVEVFGAGIFRPEVTEPFGIKVPVLAWGIGIDRLFMIRENISDIRQLFSQDIKFLREAKV